MTETKYTNRLINETSPYLLQHAHNPVDWYPWGDEAFQKAKAENKPLLLSCGYSACHWCHVMERESFEEPEIAELMNRYYVSIKVDREERPDIDDLYQHAVQLMTGQGGWPLTVFLDHERRPFYGGTYFPPVPMYGRMSFPEILREIHQKWTHERERIFKAGEELTTYLNSGALKEKPSQDLDLPGAEFPLDAAGALSETFDRKNGGFGRAPKFPNPTLLLLLFKVGTAHREPDLTGRVLYTLEQMARGGIYDQLGGGFHRYATDERWLIPHFEKMLYDNAQLLRAYTIAYQLTKTEDFKDIVHETANYIRREMTAPEGGFYATQDADSEGEEGKFYLWDPVEIRKLLAEDEAQLFIGHFHLSAEGNFEGKNILNRLEAGDSGPSGTEKTLDPEYLRKLNQAKDKLLQYREQRIKPFRDEKIITSWNGLMIGALAYAYQIFQNPLDYRSAKKAAEFMLHFMKRPDGTLMRIYKDGKAKIDAFLDDYAFLSQGLIDLYEADFNQMWLEQSINLTQTAIRRFGNGNGLYYLTAHGEGKLISRPLSGYDQAIPSGVSVHCENLMRLAAFTGNQEFVSEAEKIFRSYQDKMNGNIWGYAGLIGVLDNFHNHFNAFTFVSETPEVPEMLVKLRKSYLPYRIVVWENILKTNLSTHPARELLEGRKTIDGRSTCYPCHNFQCAPPVTDWEDLNLFLSS